jgi:hypothetical protein
MIVRPGLAVVLPGFALEIEDLLTKRNELKLAAQVASLES